MRLTTARTYKEIRNWQLWGFFILLLAAGAMREFNIFNDLTYKLILVIGPVIGTIALEWYYFPKKRSLARAFEYASLGVYEPEDERDQQMKAEAALSGFRLLLFINYLVMAYYIVVWPGFSGALEPAALLAIVANTLGTILFNATLRRRGVEMDIDRFDKEVREEREARKKPVV